LLYIVLGVCVVVVAASASFTHYLGGGILSKNELLWNIHVYMAIVLLFPQYDMYIIQLTLSPFSFLFILFAV
jgi:hypothetical protein